MAGCKKSRGRNNPKMKTKRAAKKRVSVTASGMIKYTAKGRRHCLSNKGRKRKRQLGKARYMNSGNDNLVARLIPYLK